jgi:hypothetical protein
LGDTPQAGFVTPNPFQVQALDAEGAVVGSVTKDGGAVGQVELAL